MSGLHLAWCKGKSVAVVGRAGYLTTSGLGAQIDAADVVVRVNWTLPVAEEAEPHVGTRTDVLYTTTKAVDKALLDAAAAHGVPHGYQSTTEARRSLAKLAGADFRAWTPNTGTVAIFDALEAGASSVTAYGFDFYSSVTYADTGGWINGPEIFAAERAIGRQTHDPSHDRGLLTRWYRAGMLEADPTLEGLLR